MKLINTTRTHQELVQNQLDNTDAFLVETYSAGNTDVVFTQAPKHYELLISNKHRAGKDNELKLSVNSSLKRKIDKDIVLMDKLRTVHTDKLIDFIPNNCIRQNKQWLIPLLVFLYVTKLSEA